GTEGREAEARSGKRPVALGCGDRRNSHFALQRSDSRFPLPASLMKDAWRHFTAEFIGTFALVFVGGGAIITSPLLQVQAAVVNIAFAHGLILALMVTATMR